MRFVEDITPEAKQLLNGIKQEIDFLVGKQFHHIFTHGQIIETALLTLYDRLRGNPVAICRPCIPREANLLHVFKSAGITYYQAYRVEKRLTDKGDIKKVYIRLPAHGSFMIDIKPGRYKVK